MSRATRPRSASAADSATASRDALSSSTSASALSRPMRTSRSSRITKNHGTTEKIRPTMCAAAASWVAESTAISPASVSPLTIMAGLRSSRAPATTTTK